MRGKGGLGEREVGEPGEGTSLRSRCGRRWWRSAGSGGWLVCRCRLRRWGGVGWSRG